MFTYYYCWLSGWYTTRFWRITLIESPGFNLSPTHHSHFYVWLATRRATQTPQYDFDYRGRRWARESLHNASATAVRVDQSKYVTIYYHSSSIPCFVESKICKVKLLWHPDVIFNILCLLLNSQFLTNCCKAIFTSHEPGFRPLFLGPLFFVIFS